MGFIAYGGLRFAIPKTVVFGIAGSISELCGGKGLKNI